MSVTGRALGNRDEMREVDYWSGPLAISHEEQIAVVAAVMDRKSDGPRSRFTYFRQPMERAAAQRQAHVACMASPPDLRLVPGSAIAPPPTTALQRVRPDRSAIEEFQE